MRLWKFIAFGCAERISKIFFAKRKSMNLHNFITSITSSPLLITFPPRKYRLISYGNGSNRIGMKISTKGRYALRLMADLAEHGNGESVSLKDIAERQEISIKYLEQIAILLCRAELLKSERGARGGYRLSRPPEKYVVAEILAAAECDLAPVKCLAGAQNVCPRRRHCLTLPFWEGLGKVIRDYAESVTLADIVAGRK